MSRFKQRATQLLTPIDGGKLAVASGQKSLNSRNSCSMSCCTQCHSTPPPVPGQPRWPYGCRQNLTSMTLSAGSAGYSARGSRRCADRVLILPARMSTSFRSASGGEPTYRVRAGNSRSRPESGHWALPRYRLISVRKRRSGEHRPRGSCCCGRPHTGAIVRRAFLVEQLA